jgi:hypothetical protein
MEVINRKNFVIVVNSPAYNGGYQKLLGGELYLS